MSTSRDPTPGELDWRDGQPVSRRFGDVFFSRQSGIEESRHVFLAGNALPQRWDALAPSARFVIGETGFGTGLNFATAWSLWQRVAPAAARLHFVSVERYPLAADEIASALALWPGLDRERAALVGQWERFGPGWQRLSFAGGRVTLTLLVGDVTSVLPRLDAAVDAWFLDGFAPSRNPEMWTTQVLAQVARLSRPGATFATYTVAGHVRRGLASAGFEVRREPGFGAKREMLCGRLGRGVQRPWRAPWFARPASPPQRRAIVIGAGLAGAATAGSLAARGWEITVLDQANAIAAAASGNPQGVLYAHPSPHPTVLSELALTGLQHSIRDLQRMRARRPDVFSPCGVLQLAYDPAEAARQARVLALGLPTALLEGLDRDAASDKAGIAMPTGGLVFPGAGWVRPRTVCEALLAAPAVHLLLGQSGVALGGGRGAWTLSAGGRLLAAAPVAVIAAAGASTSFPGLGHLPLRTIRGQVTFLPQTPASASLRTVICGEGYAAPAQGGLHTVGATHRFDDAGLDLRPEEHAENVERLSRLAPALYSALEGDRLDPGVLGGRAGLRCSSPDFLPLVGPVVDAAAFAATYARLAHDASLALDAPSPWLDGLYLTTAHGSRGLITAPIAGELLAAYLDDEPLPLPAPVADAVHPSRFLLRALIRRRGRPG